MTIEEALLGLESDVDREGWDQPASLWVIFAHEDEGRMVPRLLRSIPLTGDPAGQLEYWAHTLPEQFAATGIPGILPETLLGLAFCTEGWTVPADARGAMESAERHIIGNRPDRIEVRIVTAVDRDGSAYNVMRQRGATPEVDKVDSLAGRLPDSLRTLMAAMVGAKS